MIIYLASPYSHSDPKMLDYRHRVVCRVAARLMSEGHVIYSPIAHTHPIALVGSLPKGFDYWQAYDQCFLSVASEIWVLRLDGWQESVGVTCEIAYAEKLGIPVKYIDPRVSDLANYHEIQPLPKPGKQDVTEELIKYLRVRQAKGIQTYGRSLETFNDRDALKDLLEEQLDAIQYTMQAILERDERERVIKELEDKIRRL